MEAKKEFRAKALRKLRQRCGIRGYILDKRIERTLRTIIERRAPQSVLLYIPIAIEADVRPLLRWLRMRGIEVYVPFMEGESFRLVKYRLPLRKKRFGIYEPKYSNQYRRKRIDLAIVPIIGTDPSGRRVGFGKGMYDRFFAREIKKIQETIFVQRHLCWAPRVVTDPHDLHGDLIVTGRGVSMLS